MTKIIGKPLDEILKLDIDVDDLSVRQLCYIVALGMGDIDTANFTYFNEFTFESEAVLDRGQDNSIPRGHWPDYTSSWEHAGRVLESLERLNHTLLLVSEAPESTLHHINIKDMGGKIYAWVETHGLRETITKAAAKCVLEGIDLEVSE